jgi:C1A family cysteine protease
MNIEYYRSLHIAGGELEDTPQDYRDYFFGAPYENPKDTSFDFKTSLLPSKVDLRENTGYIENQERTNSCAGNAIASAAECMLQSKNRFTNLSRMFIYYNAREPIAKLFSKPIEDVGSNIRFAIGETTKLGIATEDIWPFVVSRVNEKPTAEAYADGALRKTKRYESLGQSMPSSVPQRFIREAKVALAAGYPIIFGMDITSNFYGINSDDPNQYRDIARRGTADYAGGHALAIVGYDDEKECFLIENSWGTGWGQDGYCQLKYNVVTQNMGPYGAFVLREFDGVRYDIPENWYIRKSNPVPAPTPTPVPAPVPAPSPEPKKKKNKTPIYIAVGLLIAFIIWHLTNQ